MPNLYNNRNYLIDQAFDVFAKVQRTAGQSSPDEVSFVGGFLACFGILTGRVDIGLDGDAPLSDVLDAIHKDIAGLGVRIAENQRKQDGAEAIARAVSEAAARDYGP